MNSTKKFGRVRAIGLVTAGLVAGGVLAVTGLASASTSTATPSASSGSGASNVAPAAPNGVGRGPAPVRSDEKSVSTADATTLTAEALKAVPGATVYRVETDAGDAAYEAHLTKADGSLVTVKFDKSLAVIKVESGMGQGDPRPAGAPTGAPAGAPTGAPTGPSGGSV